MAEDNPLVGEAAKAGEPVEVHAAATMAGTGKLSPLDGRSEGAIRADYYTRAMSTAVLRANAEGISTDDADQLRPRILAAKDEAKRILDAIAHAEPSSPEQMQLVSELLELCTPPVV